jgi:hypothetical protein
VGEGIALGEVAAAEEDPSRGRRHEAVAQAQQGGLARAGCAEEHADPRAGDGAVHPVEHRSPAHDDADALEGEQSGVEGRRHAPDDVSHLETGRFPA